MYLSESRTKKTKRNVVYSFIDNILTIIFQFVSRSVIVYIFSNQYLGLSSLFSSILQVLNMADLGFAAAIVYNMYKPIAEGDEVTVCALMNYYKRIYRIVGLIVLMAGILVIPAIPYLIKGGYPSDVNIIVIYLLYLGNAVISYFLFAYKTALLNALQRMDLMKIVYTLVNIGQYFLQIIALIVFRNYYLFTLLLLVGTAFKNVLSAYISGKRFPQYVCCGEVSNETKKDINSRVRGLLICNISGVTYTSFDSIILSTFIGLYSVAIYNNYMIVFNGVMAFIVLIRNAMQASVGNSLVTESKEKNYQDLLRWQFLFSVIAIWSVTCLTSLYQPFMCLWMGHDMLLSTADVMMLGSWFFVSVVSNAFYLYLSGNGMWWELRWPYILSTACNLVMNIVFGVLFGISGVLFSSLFVTIVFGGIWQCAIIFKTYFSNMSLKNYYIRQLLLYLVCAVSSILAYMINTHILFIPGILGLSINAFVCTVISILAVFLFFGRKKIFWDSKEFLLNVIKI